MEISNSQVKSRVKRKMEELKIDEEEAEVLVKLQLGMIKEHIIQAENILIDPYA